MKDEKQTTARTRLQIRGQSVVQQLNFFPVRKSVAYVSKQKQV